MPSTTNVANSSFHGLFLQQLASMTGPMGDTMDNFSSPREDVSGHSTRLLEENTHLKEQLEVVKRSLAEHQQKAATSEMTMMDAILQMKQQITQVITAKQEDSTQQLPQERTPQTKTQLSSRAKTSKKSHHDDYMVMSSRVSRKSPEASDQAA